MGKKKPPAVKKRGGAGKNTRQMPGGDKGGPKGGPKAKPY